MYFNKANRNTGGGGSKRKERVKKVRKIEPNKGFSIRKTKPNTQERSFNSSSLIAK